jgi:hypothetical protein
METVARQIINVKNYYVHENSIVRKIWGKADTILLIFAGAAAEFAVNKAVDWLYFTGRLPSDPLERLFSTVSYAREIIFSSTEQANAAIDKMRSIHSAVESSRGASIPDAAYRDVLFMLIHYSISSFEVLERKLTHEEKEEVVKVFCRVGNRMQIPGLPADYDSWESMYAVHTQKDLIKSAYSIDLYRQYKKHLGPVRYIILVESQKLLVTGRVNNLLGLGKPTFIKPLVYLYRLSRKIKADRILKMLLLPPHYKQRIRMLDFQPGI